MRIMVLLLILIPFASSAQLDGFFANAKGGVNNWAGNNSGVAFSFEAGLLKNKNLLAFSYLRSEEITGREIINSVDLSVGRFRRKNNFVFHYQAGLAPVWNSKEAGEDEKFFTIGVPLKTGIKFVPPNFFSIGLDLQANVNAEKSLYMIMLTVGVWPHAVSQ